MTFGILTDDFIISAKSSGDGGLASTLEGDGENLGSEFSTTAGILGRGTETMVVVTVVVTVPSGDTRVTVSVVVVTVESSVLVMQLREAIFEIRGNNVTILLIQLARWLGGSISLEYYLSSLF